MKSIRLFIDCLTAVLALSAVLLILAFAPVVQTWIAQALLARQPGLQGSLGTLSARFGTVRISELQLKSDGAVLTVPSLEAGLPLTSALWNRRLPIRRLVAKGWTLDLHHASVPGAAVDATGSAPSVDGGTAAPVPGQAVSAQEVVGIFRGTLSRLALPCDVSLDGADLEGDIVVPAPLGSAPARVHVIVKGGGMAEGRDGDFSVDASTEIVDSEVSVLAIAAHGHLIVTMKSPRTFGRAELKAAFSADGGLFPNGLAFFTDIAVAAGADDESYTVDLSRDGRHMATVFARWPRNTSQLAGTWKIDLQDSDAALLTLRHALPQFTAKGGGQFDADVGFTRAHALGRLSAAMNNPGLIAPLLERVGAVTGGADFDASWSGQSIRVDRLKASLGGSGAAAVVQSLQPFDVEVHGGALKAVNPAADWMDVAIRGFPLAWLSSPAAPFSMTGGDATGEFIVRTDNGGFAARSKVPLTADGVSLQRSSHDFGPKLDLSISLTADYGPEAWHIQVAPLIVGSGGSHLATIDAKTSQPEGSDGPIAVMGTWNADLPALASKVRVPNLSWIGARSASGDFSATLGDSTVLDGKVAVIGHDEHHSLAASPHIEVAGDGRVSFLAPVKITFGASVSDLSVEGTLIPDEAVTRFYLKLNGRNVVLDHLRMIAASLAAAGGAPLAVTSGREVPAGIRDRIPFWGSWAGRVGVAFDRLDAGDRVFSMIGGAFQVDNGSIRLEEGQCEVEGQRVTNVKGSLEFKEAAELPYDLKATASLEKVDSAALLPQPKSGEDPVIEGQYSIACTLKSDGINLVDMAGRAQEEFRVTSTAGIVRVLKTDVDEAMPLEKDTQVRDTLGRLGKGVGVFFGAEDTIGSDKRTVSPNTEAVLRFIIDVSEIGYDELTLTATRESDGTIRIADIAMTGGDVRLTGSGQIAFFNGLALRARPLSADLQFWGRGRIAKRLSKIGLLSSQQDEHGYSLLNQPIHFGGTLEHIDKSQWHQLLVKAATPIPVVPKKTP